LNFTDNLDRQLSRSYNWEWRNFIINKKTEEFKLEAIRMYENSERTAAEIEKEFGISGLSEVKTSAYKRWSV